jgi:hypothetical protein
MPSIGRIMRFPVFGLRRSKAPVGGRCQSDTASASVQE